MNYNSIMYIWVAVYAILSALEKLNVIPSWTTTVKKFISNENLMKCLHVGTLVSASFMFRDFYNSGGGGY